MRQPEPPVAHPLPVPRPAYEDQQLPRDDEGHDQRVDDEHEVGQQRCLTRKILEPFDHVPDASAAGAAPATVSIGEARSASVSGSPELALLPRGQVNHGRQHDSPAEPAPQAHRQTGVRRIGR